MQDSLHAIEGGKQMTVLAHPVTGATTTKMLDWNALNWQTIEQHVYRLQIRIAKAFKEGKRNKAKALQRILTHSFYAKVFAVKRTTQNKGGKTPGVDNITWKTPKQKMEAALSLKKRGYKTQPLKRVYIPKKQKGTHRPLSIPVMKCRAQQALHLLGLIPIAEMIADKNAYGFRPLRSAADALEQCFLALAKSNSAEYILEADIESCFNNISHQWLLSNTFMDKMMLKKWLEAGYIEKGKFYPTEDGTPQGGIISPTLLNVTLSGLENAVKAATKRKDKINVIIYADDFIITGGTQEVLEKKVKPVVKTFLKERGLSLSRKKTKITHIEEGFDFLGVNIRKYKGKFLRKPARASIKTFLSNIRKTIKSNPTAKTENLIRLLNPKIIGWANYHRHNCSKKTFSRMSEDIFRALWSWIKRRHTRKSAHWVYKKYFRRKGNRNWIFSTKIKDKSNKTHNLDLVEINRTRIKRHIKFRADANPFDPEFKAYIALRRSKARNKQLVLACKGSWSAWRELPNFNKVECRVT